MACNNSTTVYWAGVSFGAAPQLYSDSSLSSVAPNGWYSFGGTYRQMSGGVLGPPTSCPECSIACSVAGVKPITGGKTVGRYNFDVNVGSNTGAVIIRFSPTVNPSQLTWFYDGLTASEYSSVTWGYKEGLIGEQDSLANGGSNTCTLGVPISNNLGSNSISYPGFSSSYDFNGGVFVTDLDNSNTPIPVTLGPYNPSVDPNPINVNLVAGTPGFFTMVVPKPTATPSIIKVEIDVICPNGEFNVDFNCPNNLNAFDGNIAGRACGDTGVNFYTASVATVDGVSSTIGVNDWAFSDINGVNPQPAGIYPVVIGGVNHFVTVDSNGIVTNVAAC